MITDDCWWTSPQPSPCLRLLWFVHPHSYSIGIPTLGHTVHAIGGFYWPEKSWLGLWGVISICARCLDLSGGFSHMSISLWTIRLVDTTLNVHIFTYLYVWSRHCQATICVQKLFVNHGGLTQGIALTVNVSAWKLHIESYRYQYSSTCLLIAKPLSKHTYTYIHITLYNLAQYCVYPWKIRTFVNQSLLYSCYPLVN